MPSDIHEALNLFDPNTTELDNFSECTRNYGSPLGPCATSKSCYFSLPKCTTSKLYYFQSVFQIVLLISTLHAGFRGRGRLGAHETSARNEGAGSGHNRLVARRAITMNGKINVAATKDRL